MTRKIGALVALVALAACGVDGPPRAPGGSAEPGVTVSGDAQIGMRGQW